MAFGKKDKKAAKKTRKAIIRYNKYNNPLYPPKEEGDIKAVLEAVGVFMAALALVCLIVMNFSYAFAPEKLMARTNDGSLQQSYGDMGSVGDVSVQNGQGSGQVGVPAQDGQGSGEAGTSAQDAQGQSAQSGAVSHSIGVPATEAPTTEAVSQDSQPIEASQASEYVLPESSSRKLTKSEVSGLSKKQLRYARNEIYARHGRRFQDQGLQQYFDSKSWYQGTIDAGSFDEGVLSDVERANIDLIKAYE